MEDYALFSYLYSAPLVQSVDDKLVEVDLLDYSNERRGEIHILSDHFFFFD